MDKQKSEYANFKIRINNNPSTSTKKVTEEPSPTFQIEEFNGPRKFYETLVSRAVAHSGDTYTMENIPNCLKVIEDRRRMILYYMPNPASYPLEKILGHELDTTIYIHVGRGNGELILKNKDQEDTSINIFTKTSYQITQQWMKNAKAVINCKGQLSLSIEVLEPLPDEIILPSRNYETFPRRIPEAAKYCKVAMLRNVHMTEEEIQKRIVFIDVECANGLEHQPLPISVAALDYDGKLLIDQLICPRAYVDRYNDSIHGITEKDLLGKEDIYDVLKKIEKILAGRIIVGFDLHMEHIALKIDLEQIAGVRDLQGCRALTRIMNDDRKGWSLSDVAIKMRFQPQAKYHTALEDVQLIRKIYRKIGYDWMDSTKEEIQSLYSRPQKEKTIVTKTRLAYITQIRKEKEVERIAKRTNEDRIIVEDIKRKKEESKDHLCDIDMEEAIVSPQVSIVEDEERWITPPSSPMPIEVSSAANSTLSLADPQEKETRDSTAAKSTLSLADPENQGELQEIKIVTKGTTWTITGTNLKVQTTPNNL